MPSITLNKERVLTLIGKKVSDEFLKEKISYLGTDLEEINNKEIIVEIFPNRPDLLSEEGFARALKTFLGIEKGLKKYEAKKSDYEVIIEESVTNVRPYTACLVAKNIKITQELLENIINIQEKLHITYGRNRKKCAIGVYPLNNISFPITYKALSPEKIVFVPLGEEKEMNGYELLEKTKAGKDYGYLLKNEKTFPLFLDAKQSVMSVPPILNSKHTGTVNLETKNLFVECSGHDFDVVSKALNIIGCALSDMGGEIYFVTLNYKKENKKRTTPNFESEKIKVEYSYINKYLGLNLEKEKISELIQIMGFGIGKQTNKDVEVLIPNYRADIIHPVDIIEDICIAYGFDKIKEEKDNSSSIGKEEYIEKVQEKIRDLLIGDQIIENVNYSLINEEEQKKLGFKNYIKIKNPTSSEYNTLRSSLVPTILKSFKNNKMNEYPQKIFEIGKVFEKNQKEEIKEIYKLNTGICSDNASFTWVKQRVDLIKDLFDLDIVFEVKDYDFFIKGRSAEIKIRNNNNSEENKKSDKKEYIGVGFLGEINLEILRYYELEHAVAMVELDIDIISNILKEKHLD